MSSAALASTCSSIGRKAVFFLPARGSVASGRGELMDRDIKGEFGVAYVRAVAAAAGFFTQDPARKFDDDGIDITIMVLEGKLP